MTVSKKTNPTTFSLSSLPSIKKRAAKRIGRGYGSGKGGHTSSRGAKGEKARGKIKLSFEGAKFKKSFIRRIPLLRGKSKFKSLSSKPFIVTFKDLNNLPSVVKIVSLASLVEKGIVPEQAVKIGVKILSQGRLNRSLETDLPCSQKAAAKIIAAGGKVNSSASSLKKTAVKSHQSVSKKKQS